MSTNKLHLNGNDENCDEASIDPAEELVVLSGLDYNE